MPGTAGFGSRFGYRIATFENTAVVGAPNASSTGLVYVFEYDGTEWLNTHTLRPDDGNFREFGAAVSIHGNTLLVGEARRSFDHFQDYVYVFEKNNGEWVQQAKLSSNNDNPNDHFGLSLSLLNDTSQMGTVALLCSLYDILFSKNLKK